MKALSWLVGGAVFFLASCSSNDPANTVSINDNYDTNGIDEPVQQATSAHRNINMANPATVNCANAGGVLTMARQLNGDSVGMCQLQDGKRCEEWALMHGACPVR
jgi:putative hemolysin